MFCFAFAVIWREKYAFTDLKNTFIISTKNKRFCPDHSLSVRIQIIFLFEKLLLVDGKLTWEGLLGPGCPVAHIEYRS